MNYDGPGRLLVLGGTPEGFALAEALHGDGVDVVSSLAGRVRAPRTPPGAVRIGAFGGAGALAAWIARHRIDAAVDATHPFAQQIGRNAAIACRQTGTPLLRLERPGWLERPGDAWHRVEGLMAAAAAVRLLGRRVLLTTGGGELAPFAAVSDAWFLIRAIEPPAPPLPPHHELLLERGPHALERERRLLVEHRIDLLVTKDSGGELVAAKLTAARERGIPVVVVDRPARPPLPTARTVAAAHAWTHSTLRRRSGAQSPRSSE